MGVDYSSTVGYGFAVLKDDASEYLRSFSPYEDGEIPALMETCGWDLIGYDYCGDWMSDDQVYFFYIKGTETLGHNLIYGPTITEFGTSPVINDTAMLQLIELASHFGIEGVMGWKLIANVS